MYLLENTPEARDMRQNIINLLTSKDVANITLAYQLIKGGGLHSSVLPYIPQSVVAFQPLDYWKSMRSFLSERHFPMPNFYYSFTVRGCKKASKSIYEFDFVRFTRQEIAGSKMYVSKYYKGQRGYKMKGTLQDIAQCILEKLKPIDSNIGAFVMYITHGNDTGNFEAGPNALKATLRELAQSQGVQVYFGCH